MKSATAASDEIEAYGREGTLYEASLSAWLGGSGEKRREGEWRRETVGRLVRRVEVIEDRDGTGLV